MPPPAAAGSAPKGRDKEAQACPEQSERGSALGGRVARWEALKGRHTGTQRGALSRPNRAQALGAWLPQGVALGYPLLPFQGGDNPGRLREAKPALSDSSDQLAALLLSPYPASPNGVAGAGQGRPH